ncbi:MAG: hypothetical protein AAGH46_01230 [Bacteroidota bacterium]
MKIKLINLVLLFFLLFTYQNSMGQNFEDGCSEVLYLSSRDIEKKYRKANVAKYIYENFCSGSSSKRSTSITAGYEELLESFDFGFGSTKEKIDRICETYEKDYKSQVEESYSSETVVREAISSWLACKELNSKGVLIKPAVQKTMATIDLKQTGPNRVRVTGIRYNSDCLSCEAELDGGFFSGPETKPVDGQTRHNISPNEVWSVACDRLPKDINGVKVYVETDLAILTTQGTFKLTLPADEMIPFSWSSEFDQKIVDLSNLYKEKMDKIKVVQTDSKDPVPIRSPRTSKSNDCKCPDGYAVVGITVDKQVGGKFAVDALGGLAVTCQKIELDKK